MPRAGDPAAAGQPPRWKMAVVTWLAVVPIITALLELLGPVMADWPVVVRAPLVGTVMVPLMSYVAMPALTRLFRGWLRPAHARTQEPSSTDRRARPMSANIEAVKRFFELQYAGKYDEAFAAHANTEFSWAVGMSDNPELTAAIPWAGRRLPGAEGYKTLTGELFGEFEPLVFEARRYHDVGEAVIAEGYFKFRHRVTGKIAEADWMARFDMRQGRISGGQFYENTYAVAAART